MESLLRRNTFSKNSEDVCAACEHLCDIKKERYVWIRKFSLRKDERPLRKDHLPVWSLAKSMFSFRQRIKKKQGRDRKRQGHTSLWNLWFFWLLSYQSQAVLVKTRNMPDAKATCFMMHLVYEMAREAIPQTERWLVAAEGWREREWGRSPSGLMKMFWNSIVSRDRRLSLNTQNHWPTHFKMD